MKFYSDSIEEHVEVPTADNGLWESMVDSWKARQKPVKTASSEGNACFILSVSESREPHIRAAQLAEITELVKTQGDSVVGHEIYRIRRIDPRTLVGAGVAERVGIAARDVGADMLVIDAELSPSQTRNLEDASGLAVCDREAVILNVFQRHATTPRSRTQVEIAHLQYLRPRIRGMGLNMDQQAGGALHSRGAGETASELLARRLDDRLSELQRRLEKIEASDRVQRQRRGNCKRIVLLGYTNAGKTSLMNALASTQLSARNRPFETLDTTSRALSRVGGDVLISDTVGFIRRLPERLFASFSSTLAEVSEASLLLIVVDVSDPEAADHLSATERVLEKLGAQKLPRFIVFNKSDKVQAVPESVEVLSAGHPFVVLSAHDEHAVSHLRNELLAKVTQHHIQRTLFVRYEDMRLVSNIYAQCRVLSSQQGPTGMQLKVEGEARVVARLAAQCRRQR